MSKEECPIRPGRIAVGLLLALVVVGLTAGVMGCENLTTTSPSGPAIGDVGASTTAPASATGPSAGPTGESTAESSTDPSVSAETSATGAPPDYYMDKNDFAGQVRMKVGERVRIDLTARADEEVTAVEWRYEAVLVQERDSGTSEVGGFITECWLELEAVGAGNVTIRTAYERSDGSTRIPWVGYLAIAD